MSPRVSIFRKRAVHVSHDASVRAHVTPAYKLVIALDAPLVVHAGNASGEVAACIVPPNLEQAMGSRGRMVALFVEPGAHGLPRFASGSGILELRGRSLARFRAIARSVVMLDGSDDAEAAAELTKALAEATSFVTGPPLDARVEAALRRIERDPDARFEDVAAREGLSTTRLRHLMQATTGTSLRAHRLWHRTLDAVERVSNGAPIAASAMDAGFADHAHFTRSFVRFFGRTPTSSPDPMRVVQSYVERASSP